MLLQGFGRGSQHRKEGFSRTFPASKGFDFKREKKTTNTLRPTWLAVKRQTRTRDRSGRSSGASAARSAALSCPVATTQHASRGEWRLGEVGANSQNAVSENTPRIPNTLAGSGAVFRKYERQFWFWPYWSIDWLVQFVLIGSVPNRNRESI